MEIAITQAQAAKEALCKAGTCPTYVTATGNHMSEVMAIGTSDTPLTQAILDFVKKPK